MAHHDLVDVAVTVHDGARLFVGRCRCGWDSQPCNTSVHALALVEDHGRSSRLRSRRRAGIAGPRPDAVGPDAERSA